ncbi:hypothetical protein M8O35_16565, partial [Enterobacter roggenkampii]|uniref:hypothetical protein n=1 Tax=Enterobacter roggenkampii TaxID=1812935 RepID=UPI002075705F
KRAYCLKTQPATGETYPKSDLFNKALLHKKTIEDGLLKEAVYLLVNVSLMLQALVSIMVVLVLKQTIPIVFYLRFL